MRFVDAQFQLLLARAMVAQAEVSSGAYKHLKTQRFAETGGFRDMTDDEKLEHMVQRAYAHLRLAQECADKIGELDPAANTCDQHKVAFCKTCEQAHADGSY